MQGACIFLGFVHQFLSIIRGEWLERWALGEILQLMRGNRGCGSQVIVEYCEESDLTDFFIELAEKVGMCFLLFLHCCFAPLILNWKSTCNWSL